MCQEEEHLEKIKQCARQTLNSWEQAFPLSTSVSWTSYLNICLTKMLDNLLPPRLGPSLSFPDI